MHIPEQATPALDALYKTLEILLTKDEMAHCHLFSYQKDFEYLWGIGRYEGAGLISEGPESGTLILVYDDLEIREPFEETITIADSITPYDWAAFFFLRVSDQAPAIRVFILDLSSKAASFSGRTVSALQPLLPWLGLYKFFGSPCPKAGYYHQRCGLFQLVVDHAKGRFPLLKDVDETTIKIAQVLVKEAWTNNIVRPGGRHTISNLVAPFILAEGLTSLSRPREVVERMITSLTSRSVFRTALIAFLKTLGLIKHPRLRKGAVRSPLEDSMVTNNLFGQFDEVRFLLLDDQADLGYDAIIAYLLFSTTYTEPSDHSAAKDHTKEGFRLSAITSPQGVVDALFEVAGISETAVLNEANEQTLPWEQPRILDFHIAHGTRDAFDILLLDLRLFGEAETATEAEKAHLKRLIHFYESSGAAHYLADESLSRAVRDARMRVRVSGEGQVQEADPGLLAASFRASEDEPGGLMHLILLPLLLSYVDPSLPIVLFSSTQHRPLTEALVHRSNIINSSGKPVINGYAAEFAPEEYIANLAQALCKALKLHELRGVWRRLKNVSWTRWPVFTVVGQQDDVERNVYNYPKGKVLPDCFSRRKLRQYDAGPQSPRLTGDKLRAHLAMYYTRYLLRANYFDFSWIPSLFLEGCLTPPDIPSTPSVTHAGFELPVTLDPRNHIRRAFHTLRNRAAHGYAKPPQQASEKEEWRLASMLIFMLLLDFIEGRQAPIPMKSSVDSLERVLQTRYKHLRAMSGRLTPRHLINDNIVNWLDSLAFIAAYQMEKATENDRVFLALETVASIQRLADLVHVNVGQVTGRTADKLFIWDGNRGTIQANRAECEAFATIVQGDFVSFYETALGRQRIAKDVRKTTAAAARVVRH